MQLKSRILITGSLLATVLLAVDCSEAFAFGHGRSRWGGSWGGWGHRQSYSGSAGSYGSYGGWGGSSGGGWGGSSGGGWGGSSGGNWGGSSGGNWGGSSGGSWGGSDSGTGWGGEYQPQEVPQEAAPQDAPPPAEPEGAAGEEETKSTYHPAYGPARNSALLSVSVPADSKVFVNDVATISAGAHRRFISRNLQPGRTYTYEVRTEMELDGKAYSQVKTIRLAAGQSADLRFDPSAVVEEGVQPEVADKDEVETKLTLRVPEDAQVFLAGRQTHKSGAVRQYTTTRLAPGEEWSGYSVRVVAERDGHPVTVERTLTFKGGENHELAIDFDNLSPGDRLVAAGK